MHASDCTHESDDDADPGFFAVLLQGKNEYSSSAQPYLSLKGFSAVLLQGKNEYSSSAQPYLSLISLDDDYDTPVQPKSGYMLCVCVYVDFSPLISEMNIKYLRQRLLMLLK